MTHPRRRKPPRMGLRKPGVVRCQGHLQWVRGNFCVGYRNVGDPCNGAKMHAHHVKTRGAGGGDETVIPLCAIHHAEIHNVGRLTFEKRYGIDLAETAAKLWQHSPHGIRYRKREEGQ